MDTSQNQTSRAVRGSSLRPLRLIPLLLCLGPASTHADITFAEDLFPELGSLMEVAAREGTEIRLSEFRLEERQGDLDVTRGQRLPSVRLYGRLMGGYEIRDDIDDQVRGNVNANLTVTQPLYHWGNLERRQAVAENRVGLEALEVERKGAQHFMGLRQAYLEWLLMRERQTVLAQSIALSESFVTARRQLVEVGQSSEQDVLEMEARLLENHESLAYTEQRISELEGILNRLVGPSFKVDRLQGRPLSVIEPMTDDAFEAMERQILGRTTGYSDPWMERFSVLETIEADQLEILDKSTWPTLDLVMGAFSDRLEAVNQEDSVLRVQFYAGLQVSWNIFDGWQTDGYKRSALARKRGFTLQKEAAKSDTEQRVETLLAKLQLNLKQIEARNKRELILERRVTLLRQQADLNQITGADRIEGEIDYLEVRQRLMEARVNYLMNLMQLGTLLGMDPAASYYELES